MNAILVLLSAVAGAFIITGCGDSKRESVEQQAHKQPNVHAVSSKPLIQPPTIPPQQMQNTPNNEQQNRLIAEKVALARSQNDQFAALNAMHQLMSAWKPQGLPKGDLLRLLGPPTRTSDQAIDYVFDQGRGGWEWSFEIKNGIVGDVLKKSLD